jgi:RHS repeat-associated protein
MFTLRAYNAMWLNGTEVIKSANAHLGTYGNGIVHTLTQNTRQLPTRSLDQHPGGFKALDDTYAYDANGNVTDITDQAQAGLTTRGLAYDGLDRLTAAVSPNQWGNATYAYDPLDNIRSADQATRQYRYTYSAISNRLTDIKTPGGATVFTFGYDARGNTTSKNTQATVFDAANRMSQVTGTQTYRYDGQGRRVQTTDVADGKTTFWIYSQAGQVLHTSEARRSQNLSYIYLGNTQVATRAVAWTGGAVTVKYQHTDALGTPVAETIANPTSANTVRHSYAPYGEAYSGATDGTGYTGHVMDQGTGLTYMQQRYYDPVVGRFLGVDPAHSTFNQFVYANGNPFRFTDPDGRYSRGSGWSDEQWQRFSDSQDMAAAAVEGFGSQLQAALTSNDLASIADSWSSVFGSQSLTSENVTSMIGVLAATAQALRGSSEDGFVANAMSNADAVARYGNDTSSAFMFTPKESKFPGEGRSVVVDSSSNALSSSLLTIWSVGHEAMHGGAGLEDLGLRGVGGYKFGNEDQKRAFAQMIGNSASIGNPDHVMQMIWPEIQRTIAP